MQSFHVEITMASYGQHGGQPAGPHGQQLGGPVTPPQQQNEVGTSWQLRGKC